MKLTHILYSIPLLCCAIGCSSKSSDLSSTDDSVYTDIFDESIHDFGDEWNVLVEKAQSEGALVIAMSGSTTRDHRPILSAFERKYHIKVEQSSGTGYANMQRIIVERSRGRYTVDVSLIGDQSSEGLIKDQALVPLEPLFIHPEVRDRTKGWRINEYQWLDTKTKYVAASTVSLRENLANIFYNTKRVSESEISSLDSWNDFLEAKWKGRIVSILDPNHKNKVGSLSRCWTVLGIDWFDPFIRSINPILLPIDSSRELADNLARGKYEIAIFTGNGASREIERMEELGLPVKKYRKRLSEGPTIELSGAISVFDRAPHPYAAQLFLNWYLSKEGQKARQSLIDDPDPKPSLRNDIPIGKVRSEKWKNLEDIDLNSIEIEDALQRIKSVEECTKYLTELSRELEIYGY